MNALDLCLPHTHTSCTSQLVMERTLGLIILPMSHLQTWDITAIRFLSTRITAKEDMSCIPTEQAQKQQKVLITSFLNQKIGQPFVISIPSHWMVREEYLCYS